MARAPRSHAPEVTLALRPFRGRDAAWLDFWLRDVAGSVGYVTDDAASLASRLRDEPSLRARIIERAGGPLGLVVFRLEFPRVGDGAFEFVGVPAPATRRGYGMHAAAAAEREMLAADVRTAYAPAPAVHGIDVYFWIRLGYRPLLRPDWPCERPGVAWMMRHLDLSARPPSRP